MILHVVQYFDIVANGLTATLQLIQGLLHINKEYKYYIQLNKLNVSPYMLVVSSQTNKEYRV